MSKPKKSSRAKVLLIYGGGVPGLTKEKFSSLLVDMPELSIVADIESKFLFAEASTDITPTIWIDLAKEIGLNMNRYQGFVVLHGIDNALYTSSAISFLLQNLSKPIIFTGPQNFKANRQPGTQTGDQALRANIVNAVQAATQPFGQVGLLYGNSLWQANRAELVAEASGPFRSDVELGRIDFSLRLPENFKAASGNLRTYHKLESRVEVVNIYPGVDYFRLEKRLSELAGGVLIVDSRENLPSELEKIIKKVSGAIVLFAPGVNLSVSATNVSVVNNMTLPATVTKLMWLLAQGYKPKQIPSLMERSLVGEVNEVIT